MHRETRIQELSILVEELSTLLAENASIDDGAHLARQHVKGRREKAMGTSGPTSSLPDAGYFTPLSLLFSSESARPTR